jgi:hypothetical protein
MQMSILQSEIAEPNGGGSSFKQQTGGHRDVQTESKKIVPRIIKSGMRLLHGQSTERQLSEMKSNPRRLFAVGLHIVKLTRRGFNFISVFTVINLSK